MHTPTVALATSALAASIGLDGTMGLLACGLDGTSRACIIASIRVGIGAKVGTDVIGRSNAAIAFGQTSILTDAG